MTSKNIDFFNQNKYVVVRDAIDKKLIKLVTQYGLFDEIKNFFSDTYQVVGAHTKYADPLMESLLIEFKQIVEKNVGLNLLPTYSVYRVYRNGDVLKPHIDRESCEISSTVFFGAGHDVSEYCWPIFMDGKELLLNPGDMAIYKGFEVKHWRNEFSLSQESWQVQGFFHYVDANGPYKEFKNDKRPGLGYSWESSEEHKGFISPKNNQKSYITFT